MLDSMGYNSDMLTTKWGNKMGYQNPKSPSILLAGS